MHADPAWLRPQRKRAHAHNWIQMKLINSFGIQGRCCLADSVGWKGWAAGARENRTASGWGQGERDITLYISCRHYFSSFSQFNIVPRDLMTCMAYSTSQTQKIQRHEAKRTPFVHLNQCGLVGGPDYPLAAPLHYINMQISIQIACSWE